MPLPIKAIQDEEGYKNKNLIDYSFLLTPDVFQNKKTVVASNKDADLLFKLWSNGQKDGDDSVKIGSSDFSSKDLLRLKSMGFITGGTDVVTFTKKGKMVVTTMALAEPNKFEKTRKEKSYTEILASMNKRGKKGYRIASNNVELNINNYNSLDLTKVFKK